MIRKVYLIVNPKKDPSGAHRDRIREILKEKGIEFVEAVPSGEDTGIREREAALCDAVFTVGGDGTLIQAARELSGIDKPFFAINIGTLGYLTETTMETAPEALDRLLAGDYQIQERMRLSVTLPNGEVRTALNDAVLNRTGELHIQRYNLYIHDKLVHTYRADGLIVSTSTGSTGYNLSCGGAILEPEAQMMIITPICPHSVRMTPLVVAGTDVLTIKLLEGAEPGADVVVALDSGRIIPVNPGESLTIRKAESTTSLIRFEDDSFLDALYKKMKEN